MRAKIGSRTAAVGHQLGVARGDREVGLGEHHRHVRQHAAEERPAGVHLAQQRESVRMLARATRRPRCRSRTSPGSMSRHWPQLNTQGIARRSSMRVDAVRDAGRLPMLSSAISAIGVAPRKYVDEVRRLVDQHAIRRRTRAPKARPAPGDRPPARSPSCSASSRLASIVAATSASRLRRPSSGSEYLLAMISPCSVTRSPPVTLPAGCARIASYDGPPPRPTVPPRPWNRRSLTPCSRERLDQPHLGAIERPVGGEVAAVLVAVGVAQHHLLPIAAPRRAGGGTAAARTPRA